MMLQKRLAAQLLDASPKRIKFDNERLADIREAITKTDIRRLIAEGAITRANEKGVSRSRARHIKTQKSHNLRRGPGSRQGKKTARKPSKETWVDKIRSQREFIFELKGKELITNETFRNIYMKAKGGFFRSVRHVKIYLQDNKLFTKASAPQSAKETKPEEKKEKKARSPKKKPGSATQKKAKEAEQGETPRTSEETSERS